MLGGWYHAGGRGGGGVTCICTLGYVRGDDLGAQVCMKWVHYVKPRQSRSSLLNNLVVAIHEACKVVAYDEAERARR